jgi:hypothetical protein
VERPRLLPTPYTMPPGNASATCRFRSTNFAADRLATATSAYPAAHSLSRGVGPLYKPTRRCLGASHESRNQGYYEENNEHPEQQSGSFHGEAGDAAESDGRRDQCDDQEHQRIVKQIAHGHLGQFGYPQPTAAKPLSSCKGNAAREIAVPGNLGRNWTLTKTFTTVASRRGTN